MSLKEKAMKLNSGKGIEFMSERTKGELDELLDKECTIVDFAFINGQEGEYAVFIVKEIEDSFYFGSSVVTEKLKALEEDLEEVKKEGLPVIFKEVKSKKTKRKYINCEFYPELPF